MKEEDKIQLIEDYINDQLSMQEKIDFQQQLLQDPSLAEEVDLYKNIFGGLALGGRQDMKAHLKALDEKSFGLVSSTDQQAPQTSSANAISDKKTFLSETGGEKNTQTPSSGGKVMRPFWRSNAWVSGVAACLVVGLVAILWVTNTNNSETLFTKYYTPYPNVVDAIERGESTQTQRKQALQAYESGDYVSAIQGLQRIVPTDPEANSLYLYLGISYIETNQLDSAKVYLEKATAETDSELYTQAQWYLALAYLKNKEKEKAQLALQSLSEGNSTYAQRARQLLDEF